MVMRIFAVLAFCFATLFCGSFESGCVRCHENSDAPNLENFYFRYLLNYGSNKRAIEMMEKYLKNPTKQSSLLPPMAQERFGLHPKLQMSDAELKNALNEYADRYSVLKKINIK
jgi:hypothetical protein